MKTGNPKSPKIESDPLLAGVDDNPVYRLLRRHGNWRRTKLDVYRRHGIDVFFNFEDWVWNDLDATPLTARDYAYALYAINTPSPAKSFKFLPIVILAFMLVAYGSLNYLSMVKSQREIVPVGFVICSIMLGGMACQPNRSSLGLQILVSRVNGARDIENRIGYYVLVAVGTVLALAGEVFFFSYPVKTAGAAVLKYVAGCMAAFAIGWAGVWLFNRFILPSRKRLFEKLVVEIDGLLRQWRDARDPGRERQ